MPLYFIRHGESEANERNQFAGRQDSPLTRLGVEQAEQAGRAIARKGLVFDEIHVSPLQRARFTAQQIAEVSGNTAAAIRVSEDSCDFKIPNSRPSSENDLRSLATHVPQSVYTFGELLEVHLPLLLLGSAVLGVFIKLIIGWSLPPTAFQAGVISCLVVSTFFGLLYVDPARLSGVSGALKGMRRGLLLRVFLGMGLLTFGPNVLVQLLGTFFLLPPATLAPTLALLWGGVYRGATHYARPVGPLSSAAC